MSTTRYELKIALASFVFKLAVRNGWHHGVALTVICGVKCKPLNSMASINVHWILNEWVVSWARDMEYGKRWTFICLFIEICRVVVSHDSCHLLAVWSGDRSRTRRNNTLLFATVKWPKLETLYHSNNIYIEWIRIRMDFLICKSVAYLQHNLFPRPKFSVHSQCGAAHFQNGCSYFDRNEAQPRIFFRLFRCMLRRNFHIESHSQRVYRHWKGNGWRMKDIEKINKKSK